MRGSGMSPTLVDHALAALLLRLRQDRGWSQEMLAERSGVSVRTVRNLETGRIAAPRRASVELLLRVLDPDGAHEVRRYLAAPTPRPVSWLVRTPAGAA